MKNNKSLKFDNLLVDVVEYAFIEWLIRQRIYRAFQANYDRIPTGSKTFRDLLREHIRYLLGNSKLGPAALISSAFLFDSTPEGYKFWVKHSEAWTRFYSSFSRHI